MSYGSHSSSQYIEQLSEKAIRDEFVADRVKTYIALAIKALREQHDRNWSQKDLGALAGKPQSVISRLEDPDYGKMTLQTLLEVAAAFDLPLHVEFADWTDWFRRSVRMSKADLERMSFDAGRLASPIVSQPTSAGQLPAFDMLQHITSANGNGVVDARSSSLASVAWQ
jgi:hypothetical protein